MGGVHLAPWHFAGLFLTSGPAEVKATEMGQDYWSNTVSNVLGPTNFLVMDRHPAKPRNGEIG